MTPAVTTITSSDVLDSVWMGKPVRVHVREFALIFGILFLGICGLKLYRGAPLGAALPWALAALALVALGYLAPKTLHPLWKGWMKLAHYLSIVTSAILMTVVWCVAFIPLSYVLKLLKVGHIDLSFRQPVETYWVPLDPRAYDFKRLERQF